MKFPKNNSVLSSLIIAVAISVFTGGLWVYGDKLILFMREFFSPEQTNFAWWKLSFIVFAAVIFGLLTEIKSLKKILPYVLIFSFVWLTAGFLLAKYQNIEVLAVPVILTSLLTITIVHLKKLWQIDSELTDKLVSLASTGHILEGKSADLRIESGLKLLETFFPVSELIVFRCETDGKLNPIGRARNGKSDSSLSNRQNSWRKSVQLCEQALESRSTIIQNGKTSEDAARIALPLICDEVAIGVLYLDVKSDFEREDQFLLESFSRQLARNLQRKELRNKKLPHKTWWSSFSTYSLENRLDITSLVHGIIKEQSFSAVASSYLKEAHAIAYLDGTLAYVNRQMKHLANLHSQDLHNTDLFKLLERFKTDVFNEPTLAIRRVMQTGDSFECELNFPEEYKTLGLQITLVKIPVDNQSIHETNVAKIPACFLITFRDITARKENEKLRSDMANLMSHELRTPITSIQGFAEMLTYEAGIPEDSREYLKIIAEESNRAAKILSNFLSVANLEQSDKREVTKSPVRINKVVQNVAQDFEKIAKTKRIHIVEQQDKDIPPISADQGLITKAISNLVDNAIRYSPERSSVIISTILETDFLRVDVEDRGYGIPRDEQEKIWQKFYRVAHNGQDKQEETTGLGLSLVKEIIEQHNGEVSVQSEVGRGSRFSFKIPRI
ncbi:MAG: ATP-binding protein [Aridibacter sp.]